MPQSSCKYVSLVLNSETVKEEYQFTENVKNVEYIWAFFFLYLSFEFLIVSFFFNFWDGGIVQESGSLYCDLCFLLDDTLVVLAN